jgi:hypothetical protein
MRLSQTTAFLSISACLLAAALCIVAFDLSKGSGENRAARSFQRSVRGLGIGSALRPDWGFSTYDPRIDAGDETMLWPVPGGYSYSPEQGMMGEDSMGQDSEKAGG